MARQVAFVSPTAGWRASGQGEWWAEPLITDESSGALVISTNARKGKWRSFVTWPGGHWFLFLRRQAEFSLQTSRRPPIRCQGLFLNEGTEIISVRLDSASGQEWKSWINVISFSSSFLCILHSENPCVTLTIRVLNRNVFRTFSAFACRADLESYDEINRMGLLIKAKDPREASRRSWCLKSPKQHRLFVHELCSTFYALSKGLIEINVNKTELSKNHTARFRIPCKISIGMISRSSFP